MLTVVPLRSGCGWVQREGGPKEDIRPGDVAWIPLGEKHWHGATRTNTSADRFMSFGREATVSESSTLSGTLAAVERSPQEPAVPWIAVLTQGVSGVPLLSPSL
jgi:hypothetical protein